MIMTLDDDKFWQKNINSYIRLWILKRVSTHDTLQYNPLLFQSFALRFWSWAYVIHQSNVVAQTSGPSSCRPSHSPYFCSAEWERVSEKKQPPWRTFSWTPWCLNTLPYIWHIRRWSTSLHKTHLETHFLVSFLSAWFSCILHAPVKWQHDYFFLFAHLQFANVAYPQWEYLPYIFVVSRAYSELWKCFYFLSTFCNNQASFNTLCTGFQVRSRFLGCAMSVLR